MFCTRCGKKLADNAVVCPECCMTTEYYTPPAPPPIPDTGGAGFGLLGFFVPIVGFILYFVWKNTLPKRAGACITGVFVNTTLYVLALAVFTVIFMLTVINIRAEFA